MTLIDQTDQKDRHYWNNIIYDVDCSREKAGSFQASTEYSQKPKIFICKEKLIKFQNKNRV